MEEAVKADPGMAEAHDLLGNLLLSRGNVQRAVTQYEDAIRIRPDYGRAHYDLGAALADKGDVAGAVPHLQKAAASPQQAVREEAIQALQQLHQPRP
jgi:Flp pilus assembly protein TadD